MPKPEATDGREVAAAWNTMIANLDKDARAQELRVAEAEEALNRLRFN